MKNFSELLDTSFFLTINLVLRPIIENGIPELICTINKNTVYTGGIPSQMDLTSDLGLNEKLTLQIMMHGKNHNILKETAIEIVSIAVDGIEILPYAIMQAEYIHEFGTSNRTSYLGFNGVWSLNIDRPFYQWYHQQSGQGWLLLPGI